MRANHGTAATESQSPPASFKETLRLLGTRLLPHDTLTTTCPPAPLRSNDGPLVIVTSLMRSGTHLLLDALFNNFPQMRRLPLFLDLDAYERAKMPSAPLAQLGGITIKTHYPQTGLAPGYKTALKTLASRAIVLTPKRSSEQVRASLAKWDMNYSVDEFRELEKRFEDFWAPFSPIAIEFNTLLQPDKMKDVLETIAERALLKLPHKRRPVMPARHRFGVYLDKGFTRLLGWRAPRINTTIGYRLSARQSV